ncbi:MAG: hypothetical protein H4O13_13180 [Xanthomonadales bacterium]|mgnify:FL=1|jgi:hypothetical protein|nr:hypothetical protein [Xanthomonadales bacterium]
MQLSPLRQFILAAALWLPACFFLWAVLISPILLPVAKIAQLVLLQLLPQTVELIEQDGQNFEVVTRLMTEADASGRVGQLVLTSTPMIYAWCLPLFAGLVMAAPIEVRQRLKQFAIGVPVLWLVVSWGAVFDALYLLQFQAGPLGEAALQQAGLAPNFVAMGYQFGYLILPPVVPIVLWIGLNSAFLQELVEFTREPPEPPAV